MTGCRAIGSTLELLGKVSGQLTSQLNVTGNIAVALKGLDDDAIRKLLFASGHGAWTHYEQRSPEENEKRIAELIAKAGEVLLPASSESKPK